MGPVRIAVLSAVATFVVWNPVPVPSPVTRAWAGPVVEHVDNRKVELPTPA